MSPRLVAVPVPLDRSSVHLFERVWEAGDAVLPLDPALTGREMKALVGRMRPHVLLDAGEEIALESATPVKDGTALVIATSGTTGLPKGVVLTHDSLEAAVQATNDRVGAEPGQRWLCCLPLFHIAGLMTVLRSRGLGTGAVVHGGFDVAAIAADDDADFISVVPTMLQRLVDAEVDLSRFARVLVGGAQIPSDLLERARRHGARVSTTYGMSETAGGVVYDGVPLTGVHIELDGDGRISIGSPTLLTGYRNDPGETARALVRGRFVTQDRGRWEEDGRLRVLGRLDRTIITGGKNVSPEEVEQALRSHSEVLDAIVRGEPDVTWGETVVAEVITRDPLDAPSPEDLIRYLRDRLSPHKIPRRVRIKEADSPRL